jgi:hypothetical protein
VEKLNENVIERINQVNQKLKTVSSGDMADSQTKVAEYEAKVIELAKELWSILDEALISYLDGNDRFTVQDLNKRLEKLLPSTEKIDQTHSSTRIELYSVGTSGLYVAEYTNMFWLGTLVSTLRVLQKVGGHWQIVGRMEETSFAKILWPQYGEKLEQSLNEKELIRPDGTVDTWWERAQVTAAWPIQMTPLRINAGSIRLVQPGGIRFVSIHIRREKNQYLYAGRMGVDAEAGLRSRGLGVGRSVELRRENERRGGQMGEL